VGETPYRVRRVRFGTLPNLLSFVRILLLPLTILALDRQETLGIWPVLAVIGAALGSDALDGLLARWRGSASDFGRILDPLADKIYIGGVVLYLAVARNLPLWLVVLVVARDGLLILGSTLLVRRHRVVFAANLWGKISTVVLSLLLVAYVLRIEVIASWLITVAAVALGVSFIVYVRDALRFLRQGATQAA
jgi:CDP-diacylglycerol--glycerol-3-phosphate 3-phosphatidyltransferase